MQIKKGRVLFGYKDTFNIQNTLSEVIHAGLVKYKEVINQVVDRKGFPASISNEAEELGLLPKDYDIFNPPDEYWEICSSRFDYVLDEMIYAFANNDPDIMDYDFRHNFIREEVCKEDDAKCSVPFTIECTNQEESDRHTTDCNIHEQRCLEGRLLFAKHFNGLWW